MLAFSSAIRKVVRPLMSHPTLLADPRRGRARVTLLAFLVVAFMGAMAAKASATLEVQNYNNPAGDPTAITYHLFTGLDTPFVPDFQLGDGARTSFGPDARYGNTFTFQAAPPAGWKVAAIQCVNQPGTGTFTYDIPNGRVTLTHAAGEDQYCAFTVRKVSGPGAGSGGSGTGGGGAGSGVSPTVPGGGSSTTSSAPALLRIRAGTHSASATVRIARTSTIKGTLRWKGKTVGSARATHKAGTYIVKVNLSKKWARTFKRQGRKKVTLSLKVVVVGSNKATKVFSSGVIVRL
jgi:hypothetical protein